VQVVIVPLTRGGSAEGTVPVPVEGISTERGGVSVEGPLVVGGEFDSDGAGEVLGGAFEEDGESVEGGGVSAEGEEGESVRRTPANRRCCSQMASPPSWNDPSDCLKKHSVDTP
jgi:hypothetical protein